MSKLINAAAINTVSGGVVDDRIQAISFFDATDEKNIINMMKCINERYTCINSIGSNSSVAESKDKISCLSREVVCFLGVFKQYN